MIGIFIIWLLALGYFGFDYTRMWLNKRRQEEVYTLNEEEDKVSEILVFYGKSDSAHMVKIQSQCFEALLEAKVPLIHQSIAEGCSWLKYNNGMQVLIYQEGARLSLPAGVEIQGNSVKMFIDEKLPMEACYNLYKGLGCSGYMLEIGYIGEDYGE